MKLLGWWLMLVGTLRLASVWFGFFDIWALKMAVFSQTEMTEIHGRTFGVWTLLTCTLCFVCAFNLDNKPLYLAHPLYGCYCSGIVHMNRSRVNMHKNQTSGACSFENGTCVIAVQGLRYQSST